MKMAIVYGPSKGLIIAYVDDDLLKDFFDEIYIEGKSLIQALMDYDDDPREKLSAYIIARLAEVDPGYMPPVDPYE
jgi:hypothetical protein